MATLFVEPTPQPVSATPVRPHGNIVRAARTAARRRKEQALRATCKAIVSKFRDEYREARRAMTEELGRMVSYGPRDIEPYPGTRAGKAPTPQQIYEYLCRTAWVDAANQARRRVEDGWEATLEGLRWEAMRAIDAALSAAVKDATPALKRSLQHIALKEWSRVAPDLTHRDRDTPAGSSMLFDVSYPRQHEAARRFCTRDAGRPPLTPPDPTIAQLMKAGTDSAAVKEHGVFKVVSNTDLAARDFAFTQAR
ncbi:hypothetical protein [Sulfobacillus sp. hq2]|uniref:hypothetical protein n=1 Tax=Sulfobacillus TaxID=28033 RepID=UPI000CD22BF5|nr:hypothetical protein [Sulfobacillus sp. hq2]POB10116.1 hypothetical protein CO251_11570 [Sulfobacillus sp. hq2]